MKITSLVTWLCVVGSSIGLSASAERGLISTRPSPPAPANICEVVAGALPARRTSSNDVGGRAGERPGSAEARSAALPLEAQYAVSAALGRDQVAYHVLPNREWRATRHKPPCDAPRVINPEPLNHAEKSYQAANPNQHFNARFDVQGACVASGGTHWDLSVQAWGYDDTGLDRVGYRQSTINHEPSTIPLVSANRVEYRRGALTEWYVNGPLGLQQGFTVQAPPARSATPIAGGPARNNSSDRAPLTLVLNLPAARLSSSLDPEALDGPKSGGCHSQLDADRTGLTILTERDEPILRYSGLTALDADGRRLRAWLEPKENKLLVRVDDSEARYPITIDPFIQQVKLIAADGAAVDLFGRSVALSSDGDTAIVGADGADVGGNVWQGAAYVFTRSGASWYNQAKLTAADGAANDYFGRSVALSSDGDTAIVGASGADVGGNNGQGAAYVFTRSGASWSQQAKLTAADGAASDNFGYSVALSSDGDIAIAGANVAGVGGNVYQGAAYVFTRSGAAWSQHAKLTASDGAASDLFGFAVALSSDGDTALAGAHYADVGGNADQGAAYIFTRSGDFWTQQVKLTAVDGAADNRFGKSVALSGDGDTAIAGADLADVGGNVWQGAAYVFTRSGAAWTQQAKLIAADGAAVDYFGNSVTLRGDGNTAIVGAQVADVGGNAEQGAAYVFMRSGTAWSQQAKLTASDGAANDYFGNSVALSSYGNIAIVGASGADVGGNASQGAAYVFANPLPTGVGASLALYINRVLVTWYAVAGATGYEVWRGASNDSSLATRIGDGIVVTNYDDMNATAGTPYYYWVKATNAGGASDFSVSAIGQVLFGPDVRLNGETGLVTVAAGSKVVVTVSMNPAQYAGTPRDWWMVASTPVGLYYLNSGLAWTTASDLSNLRPVHQGGLVGLQSAVALDTTELPAGTYTFYFVVDTLNGSLDPDVVYDSATVTVAP